MPSSPEGHRRPGQQPISTGLAGIASVKGAAPFPAAAIPRPALPHAMGMLASEYEAARILLGRLEPAGWWLPGVREAAVSMILDAEQAGRNRRLVGRLRRAGLLPGTMTPARRERRTEILAGQTPERLTAELAFWARRAVHAAPWRRGGPASRWWPGVPEGYDVDYLFRVLLPRSAWLYRTILASAACQPAGSSPHDAEIVRQAVRDLAGIWHGPAVIVEITGQAGGRWLIGDGTAAAVVRTTPASFVRLVTGHTAAEAEIGGDAAAASALLAVRIPWTPLGLCLPLARAAD